MENVENIVLRDDLETRRRYAERKKYIKRKLQEIPKSYQNNIYNYRQYCIQTNQEENFESMLDYLFISVLKDKVKLSTWRKRYYAVKKYFDIVHQMKLTEDIKLEVDAIRDIYKEETNSYLTLTKGKSEVDKQELLDLVINLEPRAKAIVMVNLVSASRPSEMVRLQMRNFDLEGRNLSVYLLKQKEWQHKRLDLKTVKAVREYAKLYQLKDDDYFVGRQNRHGCFFPVQVSETGYRKMLKRWIGLSPYNLRKTQVSSMHFKGADLPSISKQTGHKSIHTISEHYLNVADKTIDRYL